MKKKSSRLLNTSLIVAALLFINASHLSAQTYAPYVTNPYNSSGVGGALIPTFADLDGDDDLDLFVGTNAGNWGSALVYHENVGTKRNPSFAPGILDPFGFEYIGGFFSPRFVDLDNDGDLDLMCGNQGGQSKYLENTGTPTNPAFAGAITDPFGLYTVGYLSSHTFADIDNDGDLDVLIGEYYGNLFFVSNQGTATTPVYTTYQNFAFGLSNVGNAPKPSFIDMDKDGDFDVLVGVENGNFYYFQNVGNPVSPTFAPGILNPFGISNTPSIYAAPAFVDLDFDGDTDLFCGDNSSIFKYFENTTPVPIPPAPTTALTAQNLHTCYGTSAHLTASGVPTGTIGWYDAPTGGNWIGGGSPFLTNPITATTTLYIQDSTNGGPSPSRTPITITVTPSVTLQTVVASQSAVCESGSVTLGTVSSEVGVNYSLYDVATGTYFGAVLPGNGGPLSFNTPNITAAQDFDIVAENITTQSGFTFVCMQPVDTSVTIEVKQPVTHTETIPLCMGENYTYADGTTVNAVMTAESHLTTFNGMAANGCDSLLTESLIILPVPVGSLTATICFEESITVNGTVYDANNLTGTEILPNAGANGCDSVVTVNLSLFPYAEHVLTTSICSGETITVNGTVYGSSNPVGLETFPNATVNGCDSIVVVNLTVLPVLESTMTPIICAEESVTINGTVYDASNPTGTEVFTGANGCDSTVTVSLNVLPALTGSYSPVVCASDSIVINGTTYSISHMSGTEVYTGASGCDSTVAISLLIPAVNTWVTMNGTTLTALPGYTYQWIDCSTNLPISGATSQSFTATSNGNYAVILNQEGCLDTSQCYTVSTVGLNELNHSALALNPNPTENSFTISGLETLSGITAIQILDLNGKQIRIIESTVSTCDVSTLESGMYYLKVLHNHGTEIVRFIKK